MKRGKKAGGVAAFLTIALLAVPVSADPAGAPNNTGTGQSSGSNGSNGTNTASGYDHNDNDNNDNNNNNNDPIVVADLQPQPPRTTGSGATHDPNLNVYYGNTQTLIGVATGGKPAANDPRNPHIVRSARGKCHFSSGTHNLQATRAMFPDRCGEPWNPYGHKCDYSSSGWRCYSL